MLLRHSVLCVLRIPVPDRSRLSVGLQLGVYCMGTRTRLTRPGLEPS